MAKQYDPMLSHAELLRKKDDEIHHLEQAVRQSRGHFQLATTILEEMVEALSAAADTLQQVSRPRGVDPFTAEDVARSCNKVLMKRMQQVADINCHVVTILDELYDTENKHHQLIYELQVKLDQFDTWKTKLAEWQLSVEDGAFKLTHFRYPTVTSIDFAEAVSIALSRQEKDRDPQPQIG